MFTYLRDLGLLLTVLFCIPSSLSAQSKPNVIIIFPDNLGVGELNSYGGVRGVPTPNIDHIGTNGIRLTNFNVEYSCTPSRIALLTGRYATRAGEDYYKGTTLWEFTIAEYLKSAGYATALYGKWDLAGSGDMGNRTPTDQGFDEWYGIPFTSHLAQFTAMKNFPKSQEIPYIWQGTAGKPSTKVKPFDLNSRRTLDREAALKGVDFIKKNAANKTPFFLYYPMTQVHFPALAHPDLAGSTGAGDMGDAMADVDYNVGLLLSALKKSGAEQNTIVIWCSDNGAEMRRPWRGSSGPWRGYYNSALEGGIRTPCVMQWPGHFTAGLVSDELVHQVDLFSTIMAAVGVNNPYIKDRILDGVNLLPFFTGLQKNSSRESAVFLNRNGSVMAVKWHHWKLWYNYKTELPDAEPDNLVRLFDLRSDPLEEIDLKDHYPFVIGIMDSIVSAYEHSLVQYPRVSASANANEPYSAPPLGSGALIPTYVRTDRGALLPRSRAIPNPDFTGSWSTIELSSVSTVNRTDVTKRPTLGSGWGDRIAIKHTRDTLEVERVVFTGREHQPLVQYQYLINGHTQNPMILSNTFKPILSTSALQNDRLVITSQFPYQDPKTKEWKYSKMIQTLWLEEAAETPWEPSLIIETFREAVPGGLSSTNRTKYSRGYR